MGPKWIMTDLPLSWGGTSRPPTVSGTGTFLEYGKFPFGSLLRGGSIDPFDSLLRDALSAMAAATLEEWSSLLIWWDEKVGELRSIEASGSFSTDGSDECDEVFDCWNDEDITLLETNE